MSEFVNHCFDSVNGTSAPTAREEVDAHEEVYTHAKALVQALRSRFPPNDMAVIKALQHLLNPINYEYVSEPEDYGLGHFEII
jgi:hypothetical protein